MSCMYLYAIGAGNNASLNTAIMTGHGRDWVGRLTFLLQELEVPLKAVSSLRREFTSQEPRPLKVSSLNWVRPHQECVRFTRDSVMQLY